MRLYVMLCFVVDFKFCTSLYDAAAWYWLQVLVQWFWYWYWYLEPKYWYLYLRHGYWYWYLRLKYWSVLVLEWLSTGYNSDQQSYLLLFGIPSPTQSFISGLKPSLSANPSHCSPSFLVVKYLLRGFPELFRPTVPSEHICFLLFSFFSCFYTF